MTEVKERKIGKFKTKEKLIEFIGFRGNVNFIANEATIESKYLSGLDLNNIVFKLTICEDNTVDFEEIDTNVTTEEQRQRLLDIMFEKTVVPYNKMMVIKDLPFKSVQKIKDLHIDLYLSIDIPTPILKLASIFEESELEVSDEQSSKLNDLLSIFGEESLSETSETNEELIRELEGERDEEIKSESQKAMEESFKKMKEEKVVELKKRLEHQEEELKKFLYEKSQAENRIETAKKEIGVLESRIDSLQPIPDPNGYYFFVSERMNEKITLDEQTAKIIFDKVSKVKGINPEAFMKLFEQGEFQIRLGHKVDGQIVEFTDYENLSEDIKKYFIKNNITLRQQKNVEQSVDSMIVYVGDLTWHDIVSKMIKCGFLQEPEFDKMCGSNSYFAMYGSEDSNEKAETQNINNMIKRFDEFDQDGLQKEEVEEIKQEFRDMNGYEMGDDFIFSFHSSEQDPNDTFFQDYGDFFITISPKSYWDNEQNAYDQHISYSNGGVLNLPPFLEEMEEGSFMSTEKSDEECIKQLINAGLKFNVGYQNHMEQQSQLLGIVGGIPVTNYMSKNYPNSIV